MSFDRGRRKSKRCRRSPRRALAERPERDPRMPPVRTRPRARAARAPRPHLARSRARRSARRPCDVSRTRAPERMRGRATERRRSRSARRSAASAVKAAATARGSASRSGRAPNGLEPEGHRKGAPLGLGEGLGDLPERGVEQVRHRTEWDRHLRFRALQRGRESPRARPPPRSPAGARSSRSRARRGRAPRRAHPEPRGEVDQPR